MIRYRIIDHMTLSPQELQQYIDNLPQWRRQQAMAYKHLAGRMECALSYRLLCELLSEAFGIEEQPMFCTDAGMSPDGADHGKPALLFHSVSGSAVSEGLASIHDADERAYHRSGIRFNMSHCSRGVACVVSDEGEVGIDIERTGRYSDALARYCMSSAEVARIRSSADPDLTFTTLWTQKEALLKLTGEGITDDLSTVLTSSRMQGVSMQTHHNAEKGYVWSLATR